MLDTLRRSSRSLVIYVLFGIVIAVFVVNFGPQSGGGCDSGVAASTFAATVNGRAISTNDYRYGYVLLGGGQMPAQVAKQRRLKETVMDKLIERELLAGEAERLGFRVGDDELHDLISDSRILSLGYETKVDAFQKDGVFDYDFYKRFVQYQLGMSPRAFEEQQRKEMLAARVRNTMRAGTNVSDDDVKTAYVRQGNQVNVEYVRFAARRYEGEVEPGIEEVAAYAKANEAKLKSTYEERKFLYEKAPRERKIRHVLVRVDPGVSADGDAAARKKAEALAARIKKGEAFAAVARAGSEDAASKARGGAIGWRRQGATPFGPENEERVWTAKDGTVLGPVKGPEGWHLIVAEGSREGDIAFSEVKLELAEEGVRQEKAKARARADAEAALARAKAAPDKSLKDLFPAPAEKSAGGAETPQAEETGLFARRGAVVEGIGTSAELAKAVFALTKESPLAGPTEVSGALVVVKLKERRTADMVEFDKRKGELAREAAMARGEQIAAAWALRRCVEAKEAKRIDVNRDLVRYEGPEGASAYEPCVAPPTGL